MCMLDEISAPSSQDELAEPVRHGMVYLHSEQVSKTFHNGSRPVERGHDNAKANN